jgi:hypothetical protein
LRGVLDATRAALAAQPREPGQDRAAGHRLAFYVTRAGRRITGEADRRELIARLSAAAREPGPTG